ncbi:MAG: RHS repeat-associated core domain-containing protein [Gemmatimonadaceae bacterium]
MRKLLGILAVLASLPAFGQTEIILDNGSAAFSATGTWPTSTSVAGYYGTNYQTHEANGAPPGAIVVDNTDPGFSATGTWTPSTAVSGYVGTNYQHHYANGEPPTAVVADNLAGTYTGTWSASTSVGGYYATNYQVHAASTGTSSFTWTLTLPTAGSYEAYARWTQYPNRASNAKYTVNHSSGADVVTVNQAQGGGNWQLLGTYSFDAGATTISLSDDANGYVIADAVMIVPPGAAPNTATWSASIPSAGSYEVYARWTQHPNRATNAKYTVNSTAGATQVIVNQMAGGGTWSLLGTYSFDAGTATVNVTDQADGYVIADAVMFLPPGSGPNTATWTPNVAQAGQYEVYAQWTASSNRATDATYTVTHAGGTTAVPVNQQANGGAWNLLGTYTLSPGTAHKVTLTDQANGYVIADAIRLVPVSVQTPLALYFVYTDHLNTPRLVADATGTTVWRWDQAEPFGNSPANEDPDANLAAFDLPLRVPGQRYDPETALNYNYFRDYDPSIGRYGESDPIGLDGGMNTYLYAGGTPLQQIDPEGKIVFIIPILLGTGAIIATADLFLAAYNYYLSTKIQTQLSQASIDATLACAKGVDSACRSARQLEQELNRCAIGSVQSGVDLNSQYGSLRKYPGYNSTFNKIIQNQK